MGFYSTDHHWPVVLVGHPLGPRVHMVRLDVGDLCNPDRLCVSPATQSIASPLHVRFDSFGKSDMSIG